MKKKLLALTVIVCWVCSFTYAQPLRKIRCGTDEYMKQLKAEDPGLEARMMDIEKQMQQWIAAHPEAGNERTTNTPPIIIPVVVHVVYANATQNISDVQVKSQIDVLNED